MNRLLCLVVFLTIITGCGHNMNISVEKEKILQADRDFSSLSVERGTAYAFDAYMDDSAVMLRGGSAPIIGREAINRSFDNYPAGAVLKWEPIMAEMAGSGDMGYTIGNWEMSMTDTSGNVKTGSGNYVTIWKKQADGSWKFIFDSGTQGQAPVKNGN
nr:DUF4440 domain-containing protein [candidate division Zixibacteria bacterium]